MDSEDKIYKLYTSLLEKYGKPRDYWQLWCKPRKSEQDRVKVLLGAVLTQRTNWRNVELALKNLEKTGKLSIEGVYNLGKSNIALLEELVRPSGFYKQKARRIFALCSFIVEEYGTLEKFFQQDTAVCRKELLEISGIGQETADDILLYAGDKLTFVIDEYTRRIAKKQGLSNNLSYSHLQQLFQKALPPEPKVYRNFHAMLVLEGRGTGWDLVSKA